MTQVNDVRDAHVETTPASTVSPWQPLSQPVFRMLWIATVVSNVGSWMSDVGINLEHADPERPTRWISRWYRRPVACRCSSSPCRPG
ncbi:Arabinose efflux permease [Enterobacter asburiae]|uniref:Arabinose efflux permease n=1 Tax=Enterobacter asburiae TaxID=61645 RepID=A0A376FJP4_ENTAS|nr:Arabinose efflux permease [Enterobacter asburiae]